MKSWGLITLTVLLVAGSSFAKSVQGVLADTTWESGVINVIGDLELPEGKTLVVQDGVEVYFAEGTSLTIKGLLDVKGTPENPVIFSTLDGAIWEGIIIDNSSSTRGEIEYAVISNVRNAIKVEYSSFRIANTDIFATHSGIEAIVSNNIDLDNVYAEIDSYDPSSFVFRSYGSHVDVHECIFDLDITYANPDESTSLPGIAASFDNSSGNMNKTYLKCRADAELHIVNGIDISYMASGGLNVDSCGVTLISSAPNSKAVKVAHVSPFNLEHMSINLDSEDDAIIYGIYAFSNTDINLVNSIIANFDKDNASDCVAARVSSIVANSSIDISFCDLYNVNDYPGNGVTIVNESVIYNDPLWDGIWFHLSPGSPCIDAGRTGNLDPDGTAPDLGMHYLYQLNNGVSPGNSGIMPGSFGIADVWPNPFNSTMRCNIVLPHSGLLNVTVYDMLGRQINQLTNNVHTAGNVQLHWNAENVASGIYFIRAQYNGYQNTRKITLIR